MQEVNLRGWVYVIDNPAMPGLLKVGFSMKDPAIRATDLAHTGSPYPYRVVYDALVIDPKSVEQRTHADLAAKREGREWFRCSIQDAVHSILKNSPVTLLESSREFALEPIPALPESSAAEEARACRFHGCGLASLGAHRGFFYCKTHLEQMKRLRPI